MIISVICPHSGQRSGVVRKSYPQFVQSPPTRFRISGMHSAMRMCNNKAEAGTVKIIMMIPSITGWYPHIFSKPQKQAVKKKTHMNRVKTSHNGERLSVRQSSQIFLRSSLGSEANSGTDLDDQ